jgi:charged multivesicular body protein 4
MNWFGRPKKDTKQPSAVSSTSRPRPSSGGTANRAQTANTVVSLRENIATQEKREQHLEKKIELCVKEAKEKMAKKDKKGALFKMKQKKLYEAEIDKIQNIKMTLETQVMNLESAAQNAETFKAMQSGKNAMTEIRQTTDIEKVDDLMDDIKEEMELADEISNALAQPVDPLMMADEDDLLAELNELEAEDVEEELLRPTKKAEDAHIDLPAVPNAALPSIKNATKEEEDELKQLEAELAGL